MTIPASAPLDKLECDSDEEEVEGVSVGCEVLEFLSATWGLV